MSSNDRSAGAAALVLRPAQSPRDGRPAAGRAQLAFTAALGDWCTGPGALYDQLARAIVQAIRRGELAPGTRLPPERSAATMLAVSRGTVMAAYAGLRQDGWVHSVRGSGTWVRDDVARGLGPDVEADDAGAPFRRFTAGLMSDRTDVIELGLSIVAAAHGLPEDLLTLDRSDLAALTAEHGYWPAGMPALREAIAARCTQLGDSCDSRSVVVTGGAQQALATAAAVTLRRGDTVVVESPTYPGAIDAFTRAGARIVTVAPDDGWADVTALRRVLDRTSAAGALPHPDLPQPDRGGDVGGSAPSVARLVDEREMYLFEDETLADLAFDGNRPASISSRATCARTLTIGSLSKSVWGGLRIGWLRASPEIAERAVRAKAAQDLGLSAAGQLLGLRAPRGPAGDRRHAPDAAPDPRRRPAGAAARAAPGVGRPRPARRTVPVGGDGGRRHGRVRAARPALGVSISPGSTHCPDGSGTGRARIAFSRDTEVLLAAAERLRQAWDDYTGRPGCCPERPET
jgi:DNA-binding transcriptional MocR family regulator